VLGSTTIPRRHRGTIIDGTFKNFNVGVIFEFTPLGGGTPHLTIAHYAPSDPETNKLGMGESPPIWGRYGGLNFRKMGYIGPELLEVWLSELRNFFALRQHRLSSSDSEILNQIASSEVSRSGGTGTVELRYFLVPQYHQYRWTVLLYLRKLV